MTYRAVKVFWSPEDLTVRLTDLGWDAAITSADGGWLIGSAARR